MTGPDLLAKKGKSGSSKRVNMALKTNPGLKDPE